MSDGYQEDPLITMFIFFSSILVRQHNSKFQANCALFDTSIKFGTLIAVTNTSIFRYSAKLNVHWFPWKPQFFKIHEFPL